MHTEALFKGPTLFRIFTRKYHWQQNDLKSIKSFGGKNLASSTRFFSHRKLRINFVLILDSVQIRRNFFPFGNAPYAKKSKRDSLHFDLLPGPLNSADFFYLLVL